MKSVKNLALHILLVVVTTCIVSYTLLSPHQATAQQKVQYRVVALNLPIGNRGARTYEGFLNQMVEEGWTFDHHVTGFAIFRR